MLRLEALFGRAAVLIAVTLAVVLVLSLQAPIPQPLDYHQFADTRSWLGIANTLDVLSNLPFALVGIAGIALCVRHPGRAARQLRVVFLGVFLTAFGSAYYHWAPDNQSLFWDRLPMSVAFTAFLVFLLTERVSQGCRHLLWPLVILGALSVVYWLWTESLGRGDLRPYLVVQFLPLLLLPLILMLFPKPGENRYFVALLLCYLLAKLCEWQDAALLEWLAVMSGHSLKHLLAGLGTFFLLLIARAHFLANPVKK